MTVTTDLALFAMIANGAYNSIAANATAITAISVGGVSINGTSFDGTANNTLFVGSVSAVNVVSNAQLSSNLASYQTIAGLSANVATLTANNATNLGGTAAASYALLAGPTFTGNTTVANLTFSGTGTRITGDFTNATLASRTAFQSSVTNGTTAVFALPNGTSQVAQFLACNNSDPTNGSFMQLAALATESSLRAGAAGTGTTLPMTFYTGFSERVRIDTSGNVGIGNTAPDARLAVTGTANVSGNVVIGGSLNAANVTATLFTGSLTGTSSNATNLNGQAASFYTNATNLSTGTVPTARLGSGTANSTTFLRGDQTWATVSAGGSGTVTSVATGSGLTGGTITTTGTLSVLANTGVIANATGLYVNSAYIATLAPSLTGTGASGNWGINVTGSAASATSPVFAGDAVNRANITTRVESGFYEHESGTTAEGWPVNDSGWQHMISCTHSNDANYFAMQIAATFGGQNWYFRNTNGGGTQAWSTMLHSGNFTSYSPGLTGSGASGNWGINITGNAATVTNGVYTTGGQTIASRTRFGPYAGSTQQGAGSNITGMEIFNNGGTGDSNAAAVSFHCQGTYGMHMHLRADGIFGIGGWSAAPWRWYVNMTNGDMLAAGNVVAYSDPRLKEEIQKIDSPVEKLKKLNGMRFKWKHNSILGHPGEYDYGVLANEVQEVFPEIVTDSMHDSPDGDKYKVVAYDKLVPALIEAIKEQQAQIESLRDEIETLKTK